ncbi:unnamed protein product [Mucor circinelloides]
MGESRTELLAWLNDLLQTRYTKVEQAGTGAAYCQIFDSIYGDVPVSKVKFEAKLEYEYVGNYKILQNVFKKHKVDKVVYCIEGRNRREKKVSQPSDFVDCTCRSFNKV